GHPAPRIRSRPLRDESAAPPRGELRSAALQGARGALHPLALAGAHAMLRAHSRLLEQVMLAGGLLLVAGCSAPADYIPFYLAGPPSGPPLPIRATLPPHAGPHPRGVGSILPRLRSLPAPSHRLAPLRDRGHRQGLLGGRPRPRQRDDLPLPRVRLLPRGHRLLLDLLHRRRVLLPLCLPRSAPYRPPPRLQPTLRPRGGRR